MATSSRVLVICAACLLGLLALGASAVSAPVQASSLAQAPGPGDTKIYLPVIMDMVFKGTVSDEGVPQAGVTLTLGYSTDGGSTYTDFATTPPARTARTVLPTCPP